VGTSAGKTDCGSTILDNLVRVHEKFLAKVHSLHEKEEMTGKTASFLWVKHKKKETRTIVNLGPLLELAS